MNELIKVKEENGKQVVSARELYLGLGLDKSNWSRWSIQNIEGDKFFNENEDWVGFVTMTNGNETKDYAITLDFAKHVAMMARTEASYAYRNYFLECERQLKSKSIQLPNFNNPAEAARAWALEYEAKQQAQLEAQEAKNNVKRLTHNSKTYTSGELAKELGFRSAIELNNKLKEMEIQFKQNGTWLLYAKYADMGYTSTKQIVLDNGKITYDRRWTGKGRDFIVSVLEEENGRT